MNEKRLLMLCSTLLLAVATVLLSAACFFDKGPPPEILAIKPDVIQPVSGQNVGFTVFVSDHDDTFEDLILSVEVLRGDGAVTYPDSKGPWLRFAYQGVIPGEHIFRVTLKDPQGNSTQRTLGITFSPR